MTPARVRRGLSLLELQAAVTIVGILAFVAAARFGPEVVRNLAAGGDARQLALALLGCQRRAIAVGLDHYLELIPAANDATGYAIHRRQSDGSTILVDGPFAFTPGETVRSTHARLAFSYDGTAQAPYRVDLAGPSRSSTVTVVPATGAIRVAP